METKNRDYFVLVTVINENDKKRSPDVIFAKNIDTLVKLVEKSMDNHLIGIEKGRKPWQRSLSMYQQRIRDEIFSRNFTISPRNNWSYCTNFSNLTPISKTGSPTPTCSFFQAGNVSFTIFSTYSTGISSWIINSGASDHMKWKFHFLLTYISSTGNKKFKVVDGSFLIVVVKGTVKLTPFFYSF